MLKSIIKRIETLGGTFTQPDAQSVEANMSAIDFPGLLFDKNWDGYGLEAFLSKNKSLYQEDRTQFYALLLKEYYEDNERPRGQSFWACKPFTPLTKGTADNDEWGEVFEDTDMVDLSQIRKFAGDGILEFHQIIYAYGYPDHYYVCLQDPNPNNPTIIGTDHEVFFKEFSLAPMSEFLEEFLTPPEFKAIAEEIMTDIAA